MPDTPSTRRRGANGSGFTLVELLVVVAILSLLLTLLMPTLSRAKEIARRALCMVNCRHLVTAVQVYANDHDDITPPSSAELDGSYPPRDKWWYQPYILGDYIGEEIDKDGDGVGTPPKGSMIRCPSPNIYIPPWSSKPRPESSWIGYNETLGYSQKFRENRTDLFYHGPPLTDFENPATVTLFQDSPSSSYLYSSKGIGGDWNAPDYRHDGGSNFGFADGHSTYVPDVRASCIAGEVTSYPWNPKKPR